MTIEAKAMVQIIRKAAEIAQLAESLKHVQLVQCVGGNLLFEWNGAGDTGAPSIDVDVEAKTVWFHAFGPDGKDIEREFALAETKQWAPFIAFLLKNVSDTNKAEPILG